MARQIALNAGMPSRPSRSGRRRADRQRGLARPAIGRLGHEVAIHRQRHADLQPLDRRLGQCIGGVGDHRREKHLHAGKLKERLDRRNLLSRQLHLMMVSHPMSVVEASCACMVDGLRVTHASVMPGPGSGTRPCLSLTTHTPPQGRCKIRVLYATPGPTMAAQTPSAPKLRLRAQSRRQCHLIQPPISVAGLQVPVQLDDREVHDNALHLPCSLLAFSWLSHICLSPMIWPKASR